MEGKPDENGGKLSPFPPTRTRAARSKLKTNAGRTLPPTNPSMGKRKSSSRRRAASSSDESYDGKSRGLIPPLDDDGGAFPPPPPKSRTRCRCPCHQRKKRKDYSTNIIPVYYGHADFTLQDRLSLLRGEDFSRFGRLVVELPQPRPMTVVDLELWILKLFRLHPETQDLCIMGFVNEYNPGISDEVHDWEARFFTTDRDWTSFVNKMKRKTVPHEFKLFVGCSELKHYDVLFKAGHGLPGTKRLVRESTMTPQEIAVHLGDNYDKKISFPDAWRAKQKNLERFFGTFYCSYNSVPGLLQYIARKPGGFVDIKDTEVVGCEDFRVLHRIFWAFAHCIQAFGCCRPVLCVKGTPLCGKYQGMLLTALALDANDFLIPVAFAVTEGETKECWLWFLRNVKRAVVKERPGVCIIHDYKMELVSAVEDIQNGPEEPHPWGDVQSRWCTLHLAENFFAHFDNKKLMAMFKRLCEHKQKSKFLDTWKELDELTLKHVMERNDGASQEMQQHSVEHDEAELEARNPCNQLKSVENRAEGGHVVHGCRKIMKFSDWIHPNALQKWSLLYDTKGARYGIMGTDITDAYRDNHVLKGIQCLPIRAIVNETLDNMEEYFKNTSDAANEAINNPVMNFPERVQDDMNSKLQKAQTHQVICMTTKDKNAGKDVGKFVVQSGQKRFSVHLDSKYIASMKKPRGYRIRKSAMCSCNKSQLLHKPCSHVIAVCSQIGVSGATYLSPYYTLSYLADTYSRKSVVSESSYNYTKFDSATTTWIPDKKLECGLPVFLTSDCIQTASYEEDQQ